MSEQMKVRDKMHENPKFAEEVRQFVAYQGWNLKEIENLSKAAYLELLMVEATEILKDLERLVKKT